MIKKIALLLIMLIVISSGCISKTQTVEQFEQRYNENTVITNYTAEQPCHSNNFFSHKIGVCSEDIRVECYSDCNCTKTVTTWCNSNMS